MKRIFAVVLTICILISSSIGAFATSDNALFDVTSLGIIEGDGHGNYRLEDPLTRAECAAILTRTVGFDGDEVGFATDVFYDVTKDDWFYPSVTWLYVNGIINGYTEHTFEPNKTVSLQETVKMLVCILGYSSRAEDKGGYPNGYMSIATELGLLKGVSRGETFTRGDVVSLIYNALDVKMFVPTGYTPNNMLYLKNGETLRSILTQKYRDQQVYEETGVVTANSYTWLKAPNSSLENDEVEIDNVTYKLGNTEADKLLGQRIEFYAVQDDLGRKTLISARPATRNIITDVSWKDVRNVATNQVKYYVDNSVRSVNIASNAVLVKNGRVILNYTVDDMQIAKGNYRLIDNDGDKYVDYIFADDYINVRVKTVIGDTIEMAPGYYVNGSRYIYIDRESDTTKYVIEDQNGNLIDPSQIPADSIISVFLSEDTALYRLRVCADSAEGILSEVSDEDIVVGGISYPVWDLSEFDISLGSEVSVRLDFLGYVAEIEPVEKSVNYGYVIAYESRSSANRLDEIELIVGSQVESIYQTNKENLDDTNTIPTLVCKNAGTIVFELADKVTIDGHRCSKTSEKAQAISLNTVYSYELNSKGQICEMNSAEYFAGGNYLSYNAYDKVFGGGTVFDTFAIDSDTIVICVPSNQVESDEDYLVPLEISNRVSNTTFRVSGFDRDEKTKKVNLMVFTTVMNSKNVLSIDETLDSVGIVEKINWVINEDDEYVPKITLLTKGGTVEYTPKIVNGKNDVLGTLGVGDLIYYVTGLTGELDNAQLIYSFEDGVGAFHSSVGGVDEQMCGLVTDIVYDEIDAQTKNLVTNVRINTGVINETLMVPQRNKPPIFLYNRDEQKISVAGISDIIPGSDKVYAIMPYGMTLKAVVIVR